MVDTGYYSKKTIEDFIKKNLCQDDKLLYKYYQEVNIHKFRSRLSKFRDIDDSINKVVQTFITEIIRGTIIDIIEELTLYMKPCGDLIISGGAAFNAYFDEENRIITTDIDTKFTPIFKIDNKLVTSKNPKFFSLLQVTKLIFWNKLGEIVTRYNSIICNKIKKYIIGSQIGLLLGISLANGTHALNRRYTLIKKSKKLGVLIDVELFAIDLQLKYFLPSEKRIKIHNIGGILDIAFMRPSEFGYEATYTKDSGFHVQNKYYKHVQVASQKFLIDDLYYLQKFKLRPGKQSSDKKRMYIFCKYSLNVKNIKQTDSLETIYNKSKNKAVSTRTNLLSRPPFTQKYINQALRINPLRYSNVTTPPDFKKVMKQLFYGLKGGNRISIKGYSKTNSNLRFEPNNGKWVRNISPTYIHNEANYRPNKIEGEPTVQLLDILYGYNPARDNWIPIKILEKAAEIPLAGLKTSPYVYV